MDKKKLIGTIIGVTLFAALIAGATYAFLTFTATVTNATYNASTMNFIVDYSKGTDISDLPQLTTATASTAKNLVVKAKKHTGSPNGNITIKLNTTTIEEPLGSAGVVNYAICNGACADNFSGAVTGTVGTTGTIDLLTEALSDTEVSYYVYFWLDASKIKNEHIGRTYSGNISATATQTE